MPKINPEILRWARETAGFDLAEAADKIALGPARGVAATERLAALEAGDTEPTRPLLLKMARQYRRPLLTFYLSSPPAKGNRGQDFRTLPDGSSAEDEAVLDVLLRDIMARQALVRAALEDEEERPRLAWVASALVEAGVERLVTQIRSTLDINLADFRAAASPEDAFKMLRDRVESLGAFVILASNLGSHHTTLGVDVFRGLAVADPFAPFVVVNDQDSRTAWSFTLLHEVAHLWLGFTGVSGGTFDREIERFCNQVASEILLPAEELQQVRIPAGTSDVLLEQIINAFAAQRKVSRSMVAYRLFLQRTITEAQWKSATATFHRQWLTLRDHQRESSREANGGPNYYIVRRHRLGSGLLSTTARLLSSGALTTVKASQVLGVKPNNVQALMEGVNNVSRKAG
ncbi:MAG: XRE family transcriptional regulator [Gemmatimonas sp.]